MKSIINRRQFIGAATRTLLALGIASTLGASLISSAHAAAGQSTVSLNKHSTPRQVAESYWRVESERDINKVGQHYHPDAIFMPPGERLVGWHNIKRWYEDSFRQFPGLEVEIVHEVSHGSEAALEWKAVLIDVAGVRHPLVGVNIVRVEDGKYREVRAYFDPSTLKT